MKSIKVEVWKKTTSESKKRKKREKIFGNKEIKINYNYQPMKNSYSNMGLKQHKSPIKEC